MTTQDQTNAAAPVGTSKSTKAFRIVTLLMLMVLAAEIWVTSGFQISVINDFQRDCTKAVAVVRVTDENMQKYVLYLDHANSEEGGNGLKTPCFLK